MGGALPWENAYFTEMVVNGRKAQMRVYSARWSEPAAEQLKARLEVLGAQVQLQKSSGGATGRAVWPEREAGFMILSMSNQPNQMIFVYYPEPGSRRGNVHFPVPEMDGAMVNTTIENRKTGTFMASLKTNASETQAHQFYHDALAGGGWDLRKAPLMQMGEMSGMAIYEKKKQVCFVQTASQNGNGTSLTLLVKGGSL